MSNLEQESRQLKLLLVGEGGREAALASRAIKEGAEVYAYMAHANPTITQAAETSHGSCYIGYPNDSTAIRNFALHQQVNFAFISADTALQAGVVDGLLQAGVPTVGATKRAAEIEWNKIYGRSVVQAVCPEANPRYLTISTVKEVENALHVFKGERIVVKPIGLTGGKGVKVEGKHFSDSRAGGEYAKKLIKSKRFGSRAIIEEFIEGVEFTVQAITDGHSVFFPPITYDYSFRWDNDTGPETGGMGCFTCRDRLLPFVTRLEYESSCEIIRRVIRELRRQRRPFKGVLNGGFFATTNGVKVVELNARFGDPECINIMSLLESNWTQILLEIWHERFHPERVQLKDVASAVVYLVPPEYALDEVCRSHLFFLDQNEIHHLGCDVFFSAAVLENGIYRTCASSRSVAISATGSDHLEARNMVYNAIKKAVKGDLQYRRDIGSPEYIRSLISTRQAAAQKC